MKKVGDIITVYLNHMGMKTEVNGKITFIDHEKITVQTGHTTFLDFDTFEGSIISEDKVDMSYIELSDIDIPENPFDFLYAKTSDEGFDYCFDGYSNWEDIEDPMFHKLRENYLLAKKALETYVKNKTSYE